MRLPRQPAAVVFDMDGLAYYRTGETSSEP